MYNPVEDYINGLKKMGGDLNKNLEAVKVWMSVQHTHNELFLESIIELKERVRFLEEKLSLTQYMALNLTDVYINPNDRPDLESITYSNKMAYLKKLQKLYNMHVDGELDGK